jgi:hypothetical protein
MLNDLNDYAKILIDDFPKRKISRNIGIRIIYI